MLISKGKVDSWGVTGFIVKVCKCLGTKSSRRKWLGGKPYRGHRNGYTYPNGPLLFVYQDKIGHLLHVGDRVNEANHRKFVYLNFFLFGF